MKRLMLVLILSMMVLGAGTVFAASFQNGSFEIVTGLGNGYGNYASNVGSTEITGWTVGGGNAPAGVTRTDQNFWQPADGNFLILLAWKDGGSIAQTFDTTPGLIYTVSFKLAGAPTFAQVNHLDFTAPGVSTQFTFDSTGKTPTDMGWVAKSVQFTAVATSSTIVFSSTDGNTVGFSGPAIDNVVVAVPEPCTLLTITFGLIGVITRRRK